MIQIDLREPLPAASHRVLLLVTQPFLSEVYGHEVRNWAELRGRPLELVAVDDLVAWLAELGCRHAALGIVDVDRLGVGALDVHRRTRATASAVAMPLILLGSPTGIAPASAVRDDCLRCLGKPLRFGDLMNTVRRLADESQAARNESHKG